MSKRRNARKRPIVGSPPTHTRPQASGYGEAGASTTRRVMRGFDAQSYGPARDIDDNNYTMRQRARILYMSAPIATSAIRTTRTNVVGTGLVPRPRIDRSFLDLTDEKADRWQDVALREFRMWAEDRNACDMQGMNTFYELQQLALQTWLTSGDAFALVKHVKPSAMRPYSMRLQLVEADRICTPTEANVIGPGLVTTGRNPETGNVIYDGVEVDAQGRVVAYWVADRFPYEWGAGPVEWTRVLATGTKSGMPNVLHMMESERPDQYRGVSYLAQAIEPILQMRRYTNNELDAAVVQSSFAAFIKTQDPSSNPWATTGSGVEGDEDVSHDPSEYDIGPGTVNFLDPGDDVVFADPSRPSSGFTAFIEAMATQVGAALEIPCDLLLKEFNSSYSASRAALLEAWKAFRMRRRWLIDDFCRPVWEIFISEAVAYGRLEAPGFFTDPAVRAAYLDCEWIGPSQGQLDPTKEISAEISAIEQGITTREAAAVRFNGSDWYGNVAELARENQALADAQAVARDEAQPGQAAPEPDGAAEIEGEEGAGEAAVF